MYLAIFGAIQVDILRHLRDIPTFQQSFVFQFPQHLGCTKTLNKKQVYIFVVTVWGNWFPIEVVLFSLADITRIASV